jgi:DNA-binding GntR family transcriptional regulator
MGIVLFSTNLLNSGLYTALHIDFKKSLCHTFGTDKETTMAEGRVEDIYDQVKEMAVTFRLRPGDRLNEVALSRELGVSRTPLREALNRLVAEKLFDFQPGTGFFCRELDAQTVFDLYELRQIIESAAVGLACERATGEQLTALRNALYATGIDVDGLTVAEACARDEAFHMGIARLSGNAVLVAQLERVNERIRYIRWVSMSIGKVPKSKEEHIRVMDALMARDADAASNLMTGHIAKRMDQVVDVVRQGISNIYMNTVEDLSEKILAEEDA